MRGLFKGSNNQIQYGYDFSSLENRVQGYYVYKYEGGPELAEALLAERPNDIHKLPYYTEYLTTEGWKTIDEITYDTLVAQYDPETKGITFVKPLNIIHSDKEETMYTFYHKSSKFSMEVSDKHRVLLVDEDDNVHTKLAKDVKLRSDLKVPLAGITGNSGLDLDDNILRLIVATQADGYLAKDCSSIVFSFVKTRKVERLKTLLDESGIPYSLSTLTRKGREEVTIRLASGEATELIRAYLDSDKNLSSKLLMCSAEQMDVMLDEIVYWDGTITYYGTVVLDTTSKKTVDIYATMLSMVGKRGLVREYKKDLQHGTVQLYRLVLSKKEPFVKLKVSSKRVETKHIRCGCLQVPSTYLMVKQHDNIFITGNCFSQDTEILTDSGWKTFDALKKEDKVLQYDPELDVSSFVIPDEIVWERYKGKMIQFEGKTTDILVTPNHRVLHKEEEYQTSLASELTEFTYPSTSRVENGSDELPTAFYELLLILRSYGTPEYLMTPRQPLVRRVKKLLDKLERTYTTQKRGTRTVIRFDVSEIAEQWDKNLATLSLSTRVELIKSMKKWAGDYVSNKFLYLENNSEEFMDSIQELCSISGFTTTVEEKEIGGYTTQSLVINYYSRGFKKAVSKKEVDYDGYVGCVSVPTGYITVRRNRKTCISGNTINARKLGIDRTDAKSVTYACCPVDNTMMLTLDGWKYYSELSVGDKVLTYNQDTDTIEEDTIQELYFYENAEVFRAFGKSDSLECTLNHRWYGDVRRSPKKRAKYRENTVFTFENVTKEHRILTSAPYNNHDAEPIMTIPEARILGWILSEGYVKWSNRGEGTSCSFGRRKGIETTITQSVAGHLDELVKDLEAAGVVYTRYERKDGRPNTTYSFLVSALWARPFFRKIGFTQGSKHDFNWSSIILKMSPELRRNFIEAFHLGDGVTGTDVIVQNPGTILDAVALCWYLEGTSRVTMYPKSKKDRCYTLRKYLSSKHIGFQNKTIERIENKDVFCPTTGNGTWIMKQGSIITITGNCLYGASAPKLKKMLNLTDKEAEKMHTDFWDSVPPLKELRDNVTKFWKGTGNAYILGIDKRKFRVRSQHSLLNLLFQSCGSLAVKYTTMLVAQYLEEMGILGDLTKDTKGESEQKVNQCIVYHRNRKYEK